MIFEYNPMCSLGCASSLLMGGAMNAAISVATGQGVGSIHDDNFIEPGDHYLLRKLATELLPWTIMGRRLKRQWFVRLGTVYDYASNAAAALAGLGIGAPVVSI